MHSIKTIASKLINFSLFQDISESTLLHVAESTETRTYEAGAMISQEGVKDPYLYLLLSGQIVALKKTPSGEDATLRILHSGETMGLTSMLEKRERSASLVCQSPVELLAVPYETISKIITQGKEQKDSQIFVDSLLKILAAKIRNKNQDFAKLLSKNPEGKPLVLFFDNKPYTNHGEFTFHFLDTRLNSSTAILAEGYPTICVFVNDDLSASVIESLAKQGVRHIALRCAGFNNVDINACKKHGIEVTRVPAYSPYAVAEHAVALLLSLNRGIHHAYNRVRDGNFRLDGLVGFDLNQKTIGIIGTGAIGKIMAKIMRGFGCSILAYDIYPDPGLSSQDGLTYCTLEELLSQSDVISLHAPLTKDTYHLINEITLSLMKSNVILINTSRGGLIDTPALLNGLKNGKIAGAGLDVYEEEEHFFFEDFSSTGISDDVLARLLNYPNVIITSHQAFLTNEALGNISQTVLENIRGFYDGKRGDMLANRVSID
jgi:D-lactate dehydrogenase